MPFERDDALSQARLRLSDLPGKLPPVEAWERPAAESTVTPAASGGLEIVGDNTQFGYQLMTPSIPIESGRSYLVRIKFEMIDGRVCVGILSGDQKKWLVAPDGGTVEYAFNAEGVDAFRVILANCNLSDLDNPRTRFRVIGGSYAIVVPPGVKP
jgi:hypothetical protein